MSETSVGVQFNPSFRPGVRPALDPEDHDRLLLTRRIGAGRLLFGLLITGFAARGQLISWSEREWFTFLFATLLAWAGLALLTLRLRITLNRRERVIEFQRGMLLPHFRRSETLEPFSRVDIGAEQQRASAGGTTTYPVTLEGRGDPLELDRPGYWEPARNLAEEVAAFLHLPLRDPNRSGKLQPEEFDRGVGRRGLPVTPVREPRKLSCAVEADGDDLLRIRIPPPDYRPFLGMSIIVGLFFLIPLTVELFLPLMSGRRVDSVAVALPLLLPLWVFFEMARAVLTNGGLLEVTPGTFRMSQNRPWGSNSVMIPGAELEDLVILEPEMGGPRTMLAHFTDGVLVARSDRLSVRLGYGLSRDELTWLRGKILRVLGTRDATGPRPKAHPLARRSFKGAFIGLIAGMAVAHLTRGPLSACLTLPFLQHVVSVGAALGLAAGLLLQRRVLPALVTAGIALLLHAGSVGESLLAQDRPRLRENPRYLRAAESIDNPRYLAGFLPVAALGNLAAFELTLSLAEILRRRRRPEGTKPLAT